MKIRDNYDLVIYHIGGHGNYGPAMRVGRFPDTTVVMFDAREDTNDQVKAEKRGNTLVVNRCIDEHSGMVDFYITKTRLSSGVLKCSKFAEKEDPLYATCATWGDNCQVERVARLEATTIDEVVESGIAPPPDVISIDAQGAELRILRGARRTLEDHAVAAVTEIEFSEIYAGQHLFDDQMMFLSGLGYRFVDMENNQFWHPGPGFGLGFHTVGEAIWFKYCGEFEDMKAPVRGCIDFRLLESAQLVRLAQVSFAFNRLSYSIKLLQFLSQSDPAELEKVLADPALTRLSELYRFVSDSESDLASNSHYFMTPSDRLNAFCDAMGYVLKRS